MIKQAQAIESAMPDILIIGGGVIGLLTAREFALAGASVTVLERGSLGQEASWAGGGILSPLYPWRQPEAINKLCRWSQAHYPVFTQTLAQETGIGPEWTPSGLLIVDIDDLDQAEIWCKRYATPCRQLSNEEIQSLQAQLDIPPGNHLWLPDIAHVRNPRLLKALRADLAKRKVALLEHHEALDLVHKDSRISAVKTNRGNFQAGHIIIAMGAWSRHLCPQLLPGLQVEPIKGQMILFKAPMGSLRPMVLKDGRYLIPRRDGRILVGSTVEDAGFDKSTSQEALAELKRFALATFPLLQNFPIERHWAGLRPGSPSGIPYIGRHPAVENLSLNCGQFRNGFVMGPASARLLADLILNRPPIVPPEPYGFAVPH